MDNASGNLPNVPPGTRPEGMTENTIQQQTTGTAQSPAPQPAPAPVPVEKPMAGMTETMLPKQPAPAPAPAQAPAPSPAPAPAPAPAPSPAAAPSATSAPAPAPAPAPASSGRTTGTLDNNAILYAPTPVDLDPPPLQDVKPLSEPVSTQKAAPKPEPEIVETPELDATGTTESPEPGTIVGVIPVPESETDEDPIEIVEMPEAELPEPEMPAPRIESEPTRRVEPIHPLEEIDEVEEEPFPTLDLSALTGESAAEPAPVDEEDLKLDAEPLDDFDPEPVGVSEETPLLDSLVDEEDTASVEEEPSLMLDLEPEDIAEEEAEAEEKKEVFRQETLEPTPDAAQHGSGEKPKSEGYVKNEFFVSEGAEDPWILPAAATSGLAANQRKRRAFGIKMNVGIWSVFTTVFFFGALLVLGAAGIAWMMRGSIGDKIEARLAKKVEEAGYYVSYDGWTYDPVRGLVLEGVTVFENAEKVIPYAKVDNVGLNTDVFTLWKTKDPLSLQKTVSFRDSNLVLFDQGAEVAHFKDLRGSLVLDENRIDLEDVKGQLEGTRFEVEGDVVLRKDNNAISLWHSRASSSATSDDGMLLAQSIILRDDNPGAADSTSSTPMFAPRTDIVIPVPEPDPVPEKEPEPAPAPEPAAAPEPIVEEPAPIEELEPEPVPAPVIEPASAVASETEMEPLTPPVIDEVPRLPVSEEETSTVPDMIEIPPADMVSSEPGVPEMDYVDSGDSAALPSLAFLSDYTRYLRIKSGDNLPLVTSQVSVDLSTKEEPKIKADGRLTGDFMTLEETALAGITFTGVDAPYSYNHDTGILNLPGFTAGYGKGKVVGDANYDLEQKILHLSEVRSNIDLIGLLTDVNPNMKEAFQNIKFLDAPDIYISEGRIPADKPLGGEIDFSYEQWAGMVIQSKEKKLSINEIRGDFKLASGALSTPRLNAKIFDGVVDAIGSLRLTDPNYPFNGSIKARGIPMESIGKYAGIEEGKLTGLLNLDYQGIVAKDLNRMGGNGRVDLKNSQLYKVPVVGPIQKLLSAAIPVFDDHNTSSVFGHFIIESGVLMTSDLLVRSDGTKVAVKGQADLSRKLTAFSAKASLDGPLGIATGLIDEQIQVEGRGRLHSPQIKLRGGSLPAAFSDDGIKNMLGISDGTAEALTAMMQTIAAGSGSDGTVIKGVGGGRTEVEKPKEVDSAANLIEGLKKRDVGSVSDSIQGLLRGN